MIKIDKGAEVPAVLAGRGARERARMCAEFESHEADYLSGARKFKSEEFKSSIYGHKSVKEKLIEQQHGKCFLCESFIPHVAHGDVEHFRPKGGWQQTATDELGQPGYYWLAYDWSNLFLACQICNQTYKRNLFPLSNPRVRARSHKSDAAAERPLLVNPALDDPEKLISYRAEVPYAMRNSRRGKATIQLAGFDRGALVGKRRSYYELVKLAYRVTRLPASNDPVVEENRAVARTILDKAVSDKAEYASMIRAAVKARFQFV